MKKIVVTIALVALALPVAALADGTQPSPTAVANQACSTLKSSLGASTFASTYGTNASKSNAFGQCVSKQAQTATADIANALKNCKTAQAADPAGFAAKYGSNGRSGGTNADRNALGKCVSDSVKQATTAETKSLVAAAKSCKAALKASTADFASKWGSKANAFGKCVAATAKTK